MIFITGANGFLGSFIVRTLLQKGVKNIVALKRENSDLSLVQDFANNINWVDGDILDMLLIEKYTKEASVVIHCAGKVSFDKSDKEVLYQVNVEGTRNMVNACLKNEVRQLIFVSSISTFGFHKSNGIISETSKKTFTAMPSQYALTKYLAELEVWRGNTEGLATLIINPSVILGPGNWYNSSVRLFHYVWKENLFSVNGYMNCVDARDVAEIIYRLMKHQSSGEQFIINAERITYQDLFAIIARHFNKRAPRIKLSRAALFLLFKLDQVRTLITGKKALITKEIKNATKSTLRFSSGKVKDQLDFDFRPIDETIKWACTELCKSTPVKKSGTV